MLQVFGLALPFFSLILIGIICGRLMKISEDGMRWMNFFIIYVALPALFFKLIAPTEFEELANFRFILATTLCTYLAFVLSFGIGTLVSRGNIREATIQGVFGSYSNVGYMGPPLTLAALGTGASVPTALIFVFDCVLFFSLVPFLMALGGPEKLKIWATIRVVLFRIFTHPFNVATIVAVIASYYRWQPPQAIDTLLTMLKSAAAPAALFALGVTVALRPMTRVPAELPVHAINKLILHPMLVYVVLSLMGGFDRIWILTAVLMAALPPALNVFVLARQYETYVQRASSGVLIGTIVSVVTLTGVLYLVTTDSLPEIPPLWG